MHIETTTPTTSVVRARRGAIAAVVALACAALLSACGSSNSSSTTSTSTTNLNTNRVALSIEQSVLAERHLHVTVTCPATVPQEKGRTFVCIATGHSTKTPSVVTKTPFKVTVENSKGYVTYKGE
jgi:7-keto-8-aminopelargonate synthetase-like enzyme